MRIPTVDGFKKKLIIDGDAHLDFLNVISTIINNEIEEFHYNVTSKNETLSLCYQCYLSNSIK